MKNVAAEDIHALLDNFDASEPRKGDDKKINLEQDPLLSEQYAVEDLQEFDDDSQLPNLSTTVTGPSTEDLIQFTASDQQLTSELERKTSDHQLLQSSDIVRPASSINNMSSSKGPPQASQRKIPAVQQNLTKLFYWICAIFVLWLAICLVSNYLAIGLLIGFCLPYFLHLSFTDLIGGILSHSLDSSVPKSSDCSHCLGSDGARWWPAYAPCLPRSPQLSFNDLPPPPVPHMRDEALQSGASSGHLSKGLGIEVTPNEKLVFRGWMNKVNSYNPDTYNINRTRSVYATLDGLELRLQYPNRNINRRSMWNDDTPSIGNITFKHTEKFDLKCARVGLLPTGLVAKRVWSKKYPICIDFPLKPGGKQRRGYRNAAGSSVLPENNGQSAAHLQESAHCDVGDFVFLTDEFSSSETLYLFARTCREKETWFRRFHAASHGMPLSLTPQLVLKNYLIPQHEPVLVDIPSKDDEKGKSQSTLQQNEGDASVGPASASSSPPSQGLMTGGTASSAAGHEEPIYVTYIRYMAKFMPADWLLKSADAWHLNIRHVSCDPQLIWLNALIGRVFWDYFREDYWLKRTREKIQNKLKKIHVPNFIEELVVGDIDVGQDLPVIRKASRPYVDAQGLWIELEIAYSGGFSIGLETKVNLMRLLESKEKSNADYGVFLSDEQLDDIQAVTNSKKRAAFVSDEEDSAESSTDSYEYEEVDVNDEQSTGDVVSMASGGVDTVSNADDDCSTSQNADNAGPQKPTKRKLMGFVNKITKSTYFQKAVDFPFVQRGMEKVSKTPLKMKVEMTTLNGTLVINIPPPPSDRLWYGFQPSPQLKFKTKPQVGEKVFTSARILDTIETKLEIEFQRVLVLPNMDDVVIPLLLSDNVERSVATQPPNMPNSSTSQNNFNSNINSLSSSTNASASNLTTTTGANSFINKRQSSYPSSGNRSRRDTPATACSSLLSPAESRPSSVKSGPSATSNNLNASDTTIPHSTTLDSIAGLNVEHSQPSVDMSSEV